MRALDGEMGTPCAKSYGADTGIKPAPAFPPQHRLDGTPHRRPSQLCARHCIPVKPLTVTTLDRWLKSEAVWAHTPVQAGRGRTAWFVLSRLYLHHIKFRDWPDEE